MQMVILKKVKIYYLHIISKLLHHQVTNSN